LHAIVVVRAANITYLFAERTATVKVMDGDQENSDDRATRVMDSDRIDRHETPTIKSFDDQETRTP